MDFNKLISVNKGLFFFYLIIAGNFIAELFSCKVQSLLSNNIYVKHIIGFSSIYFFVFLADNNFSKINPLVMLFGSLIIYIWFLFTVKTKSELFLTGFLLLLIIVILQNQYNYIENKNENNKLTKLENIRKIQKIIIIIYILVTIFGILIYGNLKKIEYKNRFSFSKFIFGTSTCSGDKKISLLKSIEKLFK